MQQVAKSTQDNLAVRSITGICLILVISGAIVSGEFGFRLLVYILNLLALFEFYRLFRSRYLKPDILSGVLLSVTMWLTILPVWLGSFPRHFILFNILPAALIFVAELFRRSDAPFFNIAITFLGIIYITLPLVLFALLPFLPAGTDVYHPHIVLGYFCILWASDSGAYASGKLWGTHKLYERISPGKTWEGSAGGLMLALLTAVVLSRFYTDMSLENWVMLAVIIVITGTFGDLTKSLLKRSLGIKDSGNIFPGHGGMLDRFDSLLGSAPFAFAYLVLLH